MKISLLVFLLVPFFLSNSVNAQFNILKKVKEKVQDRAERKVDEGIDKGLDEAEEGVKDGVQDQEEESEEPAQKKSKNKKSNSGDEEISDNDEVKSPSFKSFSKYDFVPGDQIILFEDFSQDAIGDFPALWTTNGSGEVRTTNLYPGNFLFMNASDKVYTLMKDLELPQNYIFEFDVIPASEYEEGGGSHSFYLTLYKDDEEEFLSDALYPGTAGVHLTIDKQGWDARAYSSEIKSKNGSHYDADGGSQLSPIDPDKLNHVIVWVQNRRLRVYHKGSKVLDLPTILPANTDFNRLRFSLWSQDGNPYISNIRFTTASADTRSKLLTEGKVISYGILFDVNSDKIKPESYGAINEIAKVLKENPDVKIKIVGHTDSDGSDDKNLELSKKRSISVKNSLESEFGIESSRIETDGKGEGEPVSDNSSVLGKSKNRRVEFLKM